MPGHKWFPAIDCVNDCLCYPANDAWALTKHISQHSDSLTCVRWIPWELALAFLDPGWFVVCKTKVDWLYDVHFVQWGMGWILQHGIIIYHCNHYDR